MAPLRSLGNALSSFRDFYASTGTDAVSAAPPGSAPISVTGGNTNYTYNGKKIHVWTSPGPFVVTGGPAPVEYFVVAGGGSGGADMGGGGGGGGILRGSVPISGPFSASVTVGPGGTAIARDTTPVPAACSGNPSILTIPTGTPIAATGGGRGGYNPSGTENGEPGGSGGGAYGQNDNGSGGTGIDGQGAPGYLRDPSPGPKGGGGGGAGDPFQDYTGTARQQGGDGLAIPTTFRDPSNLYGGPAAPGQPDLSQPGKWYFGGGGAGGSPVAQAGYGGAGAVATNGTTNTGGGAGGGPGSGGDPGGDGGSGIVFIAYTPS